ncbi:MAG: hypothetical protein IPP94_08355 [Ignavibacteria bacterium]|nr:hypothetical protein [Ignavibacteria bacterium]
METAARIARETRGAHPLRPAADRTRPRRGGKAACRAQEDDAERGNRSPPHHRRVPRHRRKISADLLAKAQEQAAQLTVQARAEIQREKETALAQLRTEIADLAISAAAKILKENLDDARNRKLVDEFISDLPRKN